MRFSSWASRIRHIVAPPADRGTPIWPANVRDYVEYKQEIAYRLLGDRIGISSDPETVRTMLLGGRASQPKQTPQEVRDEFGLKFTKRMWRKVERRISKIEATPRNFPAETRYEDPKLYQLMNEIRLIIIERAAKAGRPIQFPPFLASLPSGDVNAHISLLPESDQPVLFFEQGLIWFLLNFSAVASWILPVPPPEDLGDHALAAIRSLHQVNAEALEFLASSLKSYIIVGNPVVQSGVLGARRENAFLQEVLFYRMITFVFMHELAHLQLGHLSGEKMPQDSMWASEYRADIVAATFLTEIMGGWALSFWACDLVLIALNLLDRALALFEFGDK